MTSSELPLLLGETVGFRAWEVIGTMAFPRLRSVTHRGADSIWPSSRWFEATCKTYGAAHRRSGERIPVETCTCGLYAARDRAHLLEMSYGSYWDRATIKVVGEVAFAGKVIQGSQGWKAERGRIKSLIVPHEHWRWVEPLANAYRVPVELGFLFPESDRQRVLQAEANAIRAEAERKRVDLLADVNRTLNERARSEREGSDRGNR